MEIKETETKIADLQMNTFEKQGDTDKKAAPPPVKFEIICAKPESSKFVAVAAICMDKINSELIKLDTIRPKVCDFAESRLPSTPITSGKDSAHACATCNLATWRPKSP
jgi:hypothetical protein